MKVLVTNDDGVGSPGLHALARALVDDGYDVVVVAPDREMSGSAAAIGQVHIEMLWHLRRDADPAHRWLRQLIVAGGVPAGTVSTSIVDPTKR